MTDLDYSWKCAWQGIGATESGDEVLRTLLAAYAEPQRSYHTLQHLRECLELFDGAHGLAEHPHEVEVAIWFHDAVYDPRASDNELRSAQWARAALAAAGAPVDAVSRVFDLVMATRHDAIPVGIDAQVLVDIDLAILGATLERFAGYEAQIRVEYAHVPDELFEQKRRAILRAFLAREHIYATAHFRELFEERARSNLGRVAAE